MATEKKTNSTTGIRRFIATHEMRYIVKEAYGGAMKIKKAFKVALADGEHWVYFDYDTPKVATPTEVSKDLFKTIEEAKARAEEKKAAKKEKEAKIAEGKKKKLKDVTAFLSHLSVWDMEDPNDRNNFKEEYKELVERIVTMYSNMSYCQRNDGSEYIVLLENYIRTGSIRSQALSFQKSQVVSVKYGKDGSIEVLLSNGMRITPKNHNVARLIKLVMGESGGWTYNYITYPKDDHDKVEDK